MKTLTDLTAARVRELLSYEPETGVFRWVAHRCNLVEQQVAGHVTKYGYRLIGVDLKTNMAHRLAWLYVSGSWPDDEVDHINGDRDDNRIANLREASRSENQQNLARRANNTSGFPGVCWSNQASKWQAGIKVHGRLIGLGQFASAAAAGAAYLAAKARLHTFNPTVRAAA